MLGVKGSLSEYELHLLRQRSWEARKAKAERGELVIIPPAGYVKTVDQRLEKDPDLRVQKTIDTVFTKFLELGSARQVVLWFHEHGLDLPVQKKGIMGWETQWKRASFDRLMRILKHPNYAGAYVFGRTREVVTVLDGAARRKRIKKPLEEYSVLIQDHHEGYISWETFERVQQMIADNAASRRGQTGGAAKKGPALLAGILRCRRCGRKLVVAYSGRSGRIPRYCCQRGYLDATDPKCISFGGVDLDEAVSREVLRVVRPGAVEAAVVAAEDSNAADEAVIAALELDLRAARYSEQRAAKQFDCADPENRLVAQELERRWNEALEKVRLLDERVANERARKAVEPVADKAGLLKLAQDLDAVWSAPCTDVRLRKRIIRTLVEEIVVDVHQRAGDIEAIIHWKGGVHTEVHVGRRPTGRTHAATSPDVIDAIRTLALVCTDDVIAASLNASGILTGKGNRWTRVRVTSFRCRRGIPCHSRENRQGEGWLNLNEAAALAGVSASALRRAIERGEVPAAHPLPRGPWVLNRRELEMPDARAALARIKSRRRGAASAVANGKALFSTT